MLFPSPLYGVREYSAALEAGWLCPACKRGRLADVPGERLRCPDCGAGFAAGWRRHTYAEAQPASIKGVSLSRAGGLFESIQTWIIPPRMPTSQQVGSEDLPHLADFVLDLDREDLEHAKRDAAALHAWLDARAPGQTRLYYSGAKGFHLILPWQAVGAIPGPDLLTGEYRQLAVLIHRATGVLPDYKIYSAGRPLRMPDTWHPKTGRYKVEITPAEIGHAETLATAPRGELNRAAPVLSPDLNALYLQAREAAERGREFLAESSVRLERSQFPASGGAPPCVQGLLEDGLPYKGSRHEVYLLLARYWRSASVPIHEAHKEGKAFALREDPHTDTPAAVRVRDMRECIDYIYARGWGWRCESAQSVGLCRDECPLRQVHLHPVAHLLGLRA